ncbi:MAG: hypothetical protein AAFQ98_00390 [Bacteroidota bacterium]
MKKLIVAAFALGAFAFASMNSNNQEINMDDLRAEAGGCPVWDWSYCFSGNGGNGQHQRWEDISAIRVPSDR